MTVKVDFCHLNFIEFYTQKIVLRSLQYPIHVEGLCAESDADDDEIHVEPIYKFFTGEYSLDEICCNTGQSVAQIEEMVEKNPSVFMLWK